MDLGLSNKVAVVTGASEGIGFSIAHSLAQEGANVAICARRSDNLQAAAKELQTNTQAKIFSQNIDATQRDQVQSFVQAVQDELGQVDILVNNVGCATKALFEDLSPSDWEAALASNLMSAISFAELVVPGMRERQWGRILNVSAVSGIQPSDGLMASNVAKSALNTFAKTLANEVATDNVLVNTVCPGRILSPQIDRLFSEQERKQIAEAQIPLNRFGTCNELANVVTFLASEKASYVTGVTLQVDGGIVKSV